MSYPDIRRSSHGNCLIIIDSEDQSFSEIPPRLGHSCSNLHLNEDGKTTRQKTESSNDDENSSNILAVPTRMRRTSSMPSVSDVPQHKISMQPRVRHYNYNARLNKLQKRSLRFTWQRLQTRNGGKKIEDVFNEVFERLMKQVPIMRDMFTTRAFLSAMSKNDVATLRDHARIIVRMFDLLIINLDKEPSKRTDTGSEFDPRLLGKAHGCLKPYRFTANIWEILGETIIDVVLCQEAVRDLPGAGQAWVVLTACVVDQLRAGFEHAREPYGIQQPGPIPTLPNMLPPKCPHMRSLEENHTVEINLLSSQQENLKSRSHSIEQNSQPNWDETNERNGQNSSNFHNNAPRKTGRRLTDVNIQEENSEHLHKPKFSSTSATDRPLVCSRMSSRSSSSSKSQTQSLKQQSGF